MEATAAPTTTDEFYIDADGHLMELTWPTYAEAVRATYGPSDLVVDRIRREAAEPSRNARGQVVGIFGR